MTEESVKEAPAPDWDAVMAAAKRKPTPTGTHDVYEDHLSPEEEADVVEAMKEYREGKGKTVRTPEELERYLAELKKGGGKD